MAGIRPPHVVGENDEDVRRTIVGGVQTHHRREKDTKSDQACMKDTSHERTE
jgi:hypothetical protein